MKAILIIDLPEDFDYRRCSMGGDGNIYYERKDELRTSIIGNIKNLKPMPQKQNATEIAIEIEKFKVDDKLMYQVEGWNRCIDEILGDCNEEKE